MEKSIGALWIKQGKNGEYYTGNIELGEEKKKIVIFKNGYKEGNQPDFRIFEQKDKEEKQEEQFEINNPDDLPF